MKVIIMRGIPGSGKTRWAVNFLAQPENSRWIKVSADDFFVVGSTYCYDPMRVGAAHAYCMRRFVSEIHVRGQDSPDGIIVDNTNTTIAEIAPYYALAAAYEAEVKIVRIHVPLEIAAPRNVHKVPLEAVWRMHQNILSERLPPYWKEEIVLGQ